MILPFYTLLAVAGIAAAVVITPPIPALDPKSPGAFPYSKDSDKGTYIVQLRSGSSIAKRSNKSLFHKRAASVLDYHVRKEFDSSLFHGVSIQLNQDKTETQVKDILTAIPDVVAVFRNNKVLKPTPYRSKANINITSTFAKSGNPPSGSWTPVDDSATLPQIKGNADIASALQMAGVDKLHALGIKGKGIKIGIIDTGVDWRHPSLGGAFGPGHKM